MADPYEALKLRNQVCFPLYACSKELVRQYGPFLRDLGLTYTQYIVMMVLWERETVSSRDLAECLHLDYGTLTPVLRRLSQAGYLTRERSGEDERLLTLTVTESGRTVGTISSLPSGETRSIVFDAELSMAGQVQFAVSGKDALGNERTYRRILCQTYMDATKDHYIRFRVASDGKQGNNNEFMLDYLELVPKSVYGVDSDGEMEDDL